MDSNPERVQELREQKIEAFLRDLTDPDMLQGINHFDIAFVVSDNHEANLAGLKTVRRVNPKVHIVARAQDPINEKLLMQEGADLVLYPQQVVAKAAIEHLHRLEKHHLSRDLYALLASWSGVFGIVTQQILILMQLQVQWPCQLSPDMLIQILKPGFFMMVLSATRRTGPW